MNKNGQVMIVAIVILLLLAIALPTIVSMTQNESKWTVKQQRNTKSYQLAESAVEHGHQQLLISTGTWYQVLAGNTVPGFNFDTSYTGVSGGQYQVRYASGPSASQLTIYGVGRADASDGSKNVRTIKVVYTSGSAASNAITAGGVVTVGASVNVEWGSVVSYTSIDPAGRNRPRFYSAGSITGFDTNPAAPNTDNVQWWAYSTNLPSQPQIDLQYYKVQAQGQGASPAGCPAYYAASGPGNVTSCIDNQLGGRTYYYDTGDWTWKSPGTNFVLGNIILATGNMSISGNGGTGAGPGIYTADIPSRAWEEYGNNWALYKLMDSYANTNFPTYQDAVNADYNCTSTHAIPSVHVNSAGSILCHGFIYAGGGSGLSGGGNSRFHGAIITPNTATVATSNFTIYFDDDVAGNIRTVDLNISRTSWQELASCTWTGANASCP